MQSMTFFLRHAIVNADLFARPRSLYKRFLNQCGKIELMHMTVVSCRHSVYEMHMLTLADGNGKPCLDFFEIMKMVQKIGMRQIDLVKMAFPLPDDLPGDARKTMVMPIRSRLRQLCTSLKFMHMRLFFRFFACFRHGFTQDDHSLGISHSRV